MNETKLPPAPPTPHQVVYRHESGRLAEAAIIVPVHNGTHFLAACCDSIRAQDSVAIEVAIVDDASTDESCALACDLLARDARHLARALVIRHDRRAGPAAARDTGMRATTAPAALLLDADNVIYPRCVRRCLDALTASDAAFVYPMLRLVGSREGLLGYQPFDPARLALRNYIDNLTMVRRSVWQAVGGFPSLRDGLEDYAFWLRLVEYGYRGAPIPEILGVYRAHRASRTAAMLARSETLVAITAELKQAFPWIRPHPESASL
jgi:GT2 family glycosyltransferase